MADFGVLSPLTPSYRTVVTATHNTLHRHNTESLDKPSAAIQCTQSQFVAPVTQTYTCIFYSDLSPKQAAALSGLNATLQRPLTKGGKKKPHTDTQSLITSALICFISWLD
ncbi:hypothetical protein GDO81_004550 [Engystomops pustulosus]|uniref:Uncharacterized protein n=1 Tax=Engystomops pustulosus TaxID=76066 RepID=A0AAV6ZTY1_ENGPU|nr:hypothetical protein GDO81_004550 [Engystomops pustulosus]